jgi:hypothetical protein
MKCRLPERMKRMARRRRPIMLTDSLSVEVIEHKKVRRV